jgi:hypothetical protein
MRRGSAVGDPAGGGGATERWPAGPSAGPRRWRRRRPRPSRRAGPAGCRARSSPRRRERRARRWDRRPGSARSRPRPRQAPAGHRRHRRPPARPGSPTSRSRRWRRLRRLLRPAPRRRGPAAPATTVPPAGRPATRPPRPTGGRRRAVDPVTAGRRPTPDDGLRPSRWRASRWRPPGTGVPRRRMSRFPTPGPGQRPRGSRRRSWAPAPPAGRPSPRARPPLRDGRGPRPTARPRSRHSRRPPARSWLPRPAGWPGPRSGRGCCRGPLPGARRWPPDHRWRGRPAGVGRTQPPRPARAPVRRVRRRPTSAGPRRAPRCATRSRGPSGR